VLAVEHARHASWRVGGQLKYLIDRPLWGDAEALRAVLRGAAAELTRAEKLIGGEDVGEDVMYKREETGGGETTESESKRPRL